MYREGVQGRMCRGGCAGEDVQGRVWEWYAIDVSVGERQRKCVLTAGFQIHHSS